MGTSSLAALVECELWLNGECDAVVHCEFSFAILLWASRDPPLRMEDGDANGEVESKSQRYRAYI